MKKLSALVCACLWLIFLCLSVSAQDFQTVRSGVEYAKLSRQMKSADGRDENVVFNLLRLDLTKVRLKVAHATDAAIGVETTSSIAARHGAIAAINAGFFRLDKSLFAGDDVGALMIDRKLLSEGSGRVALIIRNNESNTQTSIEKLGVSLNWLPQKLKFKISGINRERKNDEIIVYTPQFHLTTLTDNSGIEFVVAADNKIVKIFDGKGSNVIPENGVIFSAGSKLKDELRFLKIGDELAASFRLERPNKNIYTSNPEDIVGGVPQLVKNGKIEIDYEAEKTNKAFVETHHPRTAVAKLKDGKFLMVTVDGRSEESGGISLPDLAAFLLEMGATDAMNLDGGGSTTMFLDGKIVNHPSDKEGERAVGDAILVFPRK